MKLVMTGLDHKHASLEVREKFALTKEQTRRTLMHIKAGCVCDSFCGGINGDFGLDACGGITGGFRGGFVIISTCNRTELYATVPHAVAFEPAKTLCSALGLDYFNYERYFTERTGNQAIDHLCRVASGLDSQIIGDDQVIAQVRGALELSRGCKCTDSYSETIFNLCVHAAKRIKTGVILKTLGYDSIPRKTVEKLASMRPLTGLHAVVIGNGQTGRLVSELLLDEGANVTITLREYRTGVPRVPKRADVIGYSERHKAIGQADIVVSATTSPHFTIRKDELAECRHAKPAIFVDLAVPRDIDPAVGELPDVTLLSIDDISGGNRSLPPGSIAAIDAIIAECIEKYQNWQIYKESIMTVTAGSKEDGRLSAVRGIL